MIVSVCSLKGGVGKTSVVLGLASAAAAKGVPTLVIDLDPQADVSQSLDVPEPAAGDGTVADLMGAARRPGIAELAVSSGWVADGEPALDLVPGSPELSESERPATSPRAVARLTNRLSAALNEVGDDYRLVLIDCPPTLGAITLAGLSCSHRALVVTEPALFSVSAADRALHAIAELRRHGSDNLQPLGVLVNRYRERSSEHQFRVAELTEMFGPLVLSPMVPERSVVQQAQGASEPIHRWPGAAAAEVASAFDAHLARILRMSGRLSAPTRRTA